MHQNHYFVSGLINNGLPKLENITHVICIEYMGVAASAEFMHSLLLPIYRYILNFSTVHVK